MSHPDRFAPSGGVSRNAVIAGSVIALHVAGIWALQSGLLRRAAEVIVPAELLSEFIAPPGQDRPRQPRENISGASRCAPCGSSRLCIEWIIRATHHIGGALENHGGTRESGSKPSSSRRGGTNLLARQGFAPGREQRS